MTLKNAIEILKNYQIILQLVEDNWIKKSDELTNQDLKEITEMMSRIARRDRLIIQDTLNKLKPKKSVKMSKIRKNS